MSTIIEQLGLDVTFFYQLAIFTVLFAVLGQLFFKPFLKLFQDRHEKTIQDRDAAEKLMHDANLKLEEYRRKLQEERANARREYETLLNQAKKEEAEILAKARDEAKRITQEAAESVSGQRDKLRAQLQSDVDSLAQLISDRLLSRNVK